jgi:hypothetical protein
MKKYTLLSYQLPFPALFVGEIIALPIAAYFLFPIIGLLGVVTLFVFWLPGVFALITFLNSKNNRIEISETGVTFYKNGNILTSFDWGEVDKFGFQASVAKRVGSYTVTPYLAFKLLESSHSKLDILESSKEFGLIQKKSDFEKYMAQEKLDLYLSMRTVNESDQGMVSLFSAKPIFLKSISPLVKTNDQAEYDNVVKENFTSYTNS